MDEETLTEMNSREIEEIMEELRVGIDVQGPAYFKNWIHRCEWLPCDEKKNSGQCDHKTYDLIDFMHNIFECAAFCINNHLNVSYFAICLVVKELFDFCGAEISVRKNSNDKMEVVLTTDESTCIGFGREISA